jgi:glutamine synthetase
VKGVKKLPLNLLDALRAFGASGLYQKSFGTEFVGAYIKLKTQAWDDYSRHLTKWELENTLDC